LDGRNISVPGYEKGNFVGPTILTDVKVATDIAITFMMNLIHYHPTFLKMYSCEEGVLL